MKKLKQTRAVTYRRYGVPALILEGVWLTEKYRLQIGDQVDMDTKQYQEKFIDELNEQIWRKAVNIEFDETKVPAVQELQASKFKELDDLKLELAAVDPKDTTKITRTKRKELEAKIAKAEEFSVNCDETISIINESIRKNKEKITGLKQRVEFAKTFVYDDSHYANNN